MKRKLLLSGVVLFLASVLVCFLFYRHQRAVCSQRGAALAARVEKLKHDSREKLSFGTKKEAVVRFFAENGIPIAFVGDEATGTISTTGCSPFGCGSDAALLGLRVKVDKVGTVMSEPDAGAMYVDCL